jgi:enoyl-CoA hydratase
VTTSSAFCTSERDGPILHVWLNRPEARNALSIGLEDEWADLLDRAEADEEVRVVTVRGRGPVFSAGDDLKEIARLFGPTDNVDGATPADEATRRAMTKRRLTATLDRAWTFYKPLIAGVHGYVGPAAMKLISQFDFVLSVAGTRLSFEGVRNGIVSPVGNPLVFHFPPNVWKKLELMGGWMTSEQAHDLHFVSRLVADEDELDREINRWAKQLAEIAPEHLRSAKMGIHRQYELMGLAAMDWESGPPTRELQAFQEDGLKPIKADGLMKTLKERSAAFDEQISKV